MDVHKQKTAAVGREDRKLLDTMNLTSRRLEIYQQVSTIIVLKLISLKYLWYYTKLGGCCPVLANTFFFI